jgi:hypothetical protein
MRKLAPVIILLLCVVETGLQPKKDRNFMQSASRGFGPASRCKAALKPLGVNTYQLTPDSTPTAFKEAFDTSTLQHLFSHNYGTREINDTP